jgi:PTH1 family peptidyl-tRNA hydrolase
MVVDHLAAGSGQRFSLQKALRADVVQGRLAPSGGIPGPRLLLAKPTSFMNESGGPVSALVRFFSVPAARVLVVHDELDIPPGDVRLKFGGGEGGHNGLRSISQSLGTKDYSRVRVGIGRPPGRMDAADYVLQDFPRADKAETELLIVEAADAVERVLRAGWEPAQQVVNARTAPSR